MKFFPNKLIKVCKFFFFPQRTKSPSTEKERSNSDPTKGNTDLDEVASRFLDNVNLEKVKETVVQHDSQSEQTKMRQAPRNYNPEPQKILKVRSMNKVMQTAFTPCSIPYSKLVPTTYTTYVPKESLSTNRNKPHRQPQGMVRVPRNTNVPLIIYKPRQCKPSSPPQPLVQQPRICPPTQSHPVTPFAGMKNRRLPPPRYSEEFIQTLPTLKPILNSRHNGSLSTTAETMATPSMERLVVPAESVTSLLLKKSTKKRHEIKQQHSCDETLSTKFYDLSVMQVYEHFLNSDCSSYADIFKEQV